MSAYDDLRHVRGTRVYAQDAIYHLRTTTIDQMQFLADNTCKQIVLTAVRNAASLLGVDVLAYVIMPEHIHLIVRPSADKDISQFVASLKKRSAREINRHIGRRGAVWRKEFFDHMLRSQEHLEGLVRYIHDNPVRRGLAASAEDWEFSSWREIYGARFPNRAR